ncbi:MAG: GTPase ObgE [bacterium]
MFIDEKELEIQAGRGGDGVALFRREIYVPKGGPDGGDGGRGGDVIIEGRANMHALSHLSAIDRLKAENGEKGGHKTSTGRSGEDSMILVPLGTVVEQWIPETETWKQIGELVEEGQSMVVATGGNGGWGNWHFKSSVQQAPDRWNPGLEGDKMRLRLVLKLIADIGLVGLPNAGKSTFLASVSAAQPKVANYPFTTLEPQLGVAEVGTGEDRTQLVIADLPGLIEGASQGKGLGAVFLKHVERTHRILHLIDSSATTEEILHNYRVIRTELETWSPVLLAKQETIVLTKIELIDPEELAEKITSLKTSIGKPVHAISAAAHKGVKELLTECAKDVIV